MRTLKHLHDSTLKRVDLDWVVGSLAASFIVGADQHEVRIVGDGVKSFSYDRQFPWGRSASVNECQIESDRAEAVLTIEMQSGDILIGKANSFSVDDTAR